MFTHSLDWVLSLALVGRVFLWRRNWSFTDQDLQRPLEHLDRSLCIGDRRTVREWPLTSRTNRYSRYETDIN